MKSFFKKYIELHEPKFRPVTPMAEYYYFCGISCYECEVVHCDVGGYKEPFVHKSHLKEFKEKNPEYFI